MTWGSAAAFFAMGGYAFYVWGAYMVTLLVLTAELVLVLRRYRRARRALQERRRDVPGQPG